MAARAVAGAGRCVRAWLARVEAAQGTTMISRGRPLRRPCRRNAETWARAMRAYAMCPGLVKVFGGRETPITAT